MATAIITKLRVPEFESWKAMYDKGEAMRRESGVRGVALFRDATDPVLVTIVTRFDSVDAAKRMIESDAFKEAAKRSGATSMEISYTEIADERTY